MNSTLQSKLCESVKDLEKRHLSSPRSPGCTPKALTCIQISKGRGSGGSCRGRQQRGGGKPDGHLPQGGRRQGDCPLEPQEAVQPLLTQPWPRTVGELGSDPAAAQDYGRARFRPSRGPELWESSIPTQPWPRTVGELGSDPAAAATGKVLQTEGKWSNLGGYKTTQSTHLGLPADFHFPSGASSLLCDFILPEEQKGGVAVVAPGMNHTLGWVPPRDWKKTTQRHPFLQTKLPSQQARGRLV